MLDSIVLVCDRVDSLSEIDLYSDNLEFTSPVYYNALYAALCECARQVHVYSSPKELIDNIALHQDSLVLSAIWSGVQSRNRKSLIAAICEAYKIAYLGADTFVQTICQDKYLSKLICSNYGLEIPQGVLVDNSIGASDLRLINYPAIVKPNCEGSSIGISDDSIAYDHQDAHRKARNLLRGFKPILVEEYIEGVEVSICLAGTRERVQVCEAVMLKVNGMSHFNNQIWGFESKKGGQAYCEREIITKEVDPKVLHEAKRLFYELGKVDYMRIDGRIRQGKFYLIELTPDCSLHPECFMSTAFCHTGHSYTAMVKALVELSQKATPLTPGNQY